jgi:hypothetical protein
MVCLFDLPISVDARSLRQSLLLLDVLSTLSLTTSELEELRVPDRSGTLRTPAELWFNDLEHRITQLELPNDKFPANSQVTQDLARWLGIAFLSELSLRDLVDDDSDDEDDMGEALTTRIGNVLRQYTEDRAILEFVANAVDAGASTFTVILDEVTHRTRGDFLTSKARPSSSTTMLFSKM